MSPSQNQMPVAAYPICPSAATHRKSPMASNLRQILSRRAVDKSIIA